MLPVTVATVATATVAVVAVAPQLRRSIETR